MAGIYVHIPFCKQACTYCNFHFSTSLRGLEEMTRAIAREAEIRRDYLEGERVDTLYFGGGTPSLLHAGWLEGIIGRIRSLFPISPDVEITLEANPDDLSNTRLAELRSCGVNRLSIGIQSLVDADLRWMNRSHDAPEALASLRMARECGFRNLSADLIYGMPTLDEESLRRQARQLVSLEIPHLSCYALTVEPSTALDHQIRKNDFRPPDPEQAARHFELLDQELTASGYEHYEISNFALPGYRSGHNSNYWKGVSYLGLGPSAHSFNGISRQWNISHNARYLEAIGKGIIPAGSELLTATQHRNESLLVSLRTREGLDLKGFGERWGKQEADGLLEESQRFLEEGLLILEGSRLRMSLRGWLLADGITAALFRTAESGPFLPMGGMVTEGADQVSQDQPSQEHQDEGTSKYRKRKGHKRR